LEGWFRNESFWNTFVYGYDIKNMLELSDKLSNECITDSFKYERIKGILREHESLRCLDEDNKRIFYDQDCGTHEYFGWLQEELGKTLFEKLKLLSDYSFELNHYLVNLATDIELVFHDIIYEIVKSSNVLDNIIEDDEKNDKNSGFLFRLKSFAKHKSV